MSSLWTLWRERGQDNKSIKKSITLIKGACVDRIFNADK